MGEIPKRRTRHARFRLPIGIAAGIVTALFFGRGAAASADASTCQPAKTDANGGPYPALLAADCRGRKAITIKVTADPALAGGFAPSNVIVSKGTVVTWVWVSPGHNVAPFHNDIELTGFKFSKVFKTSGSFPFLCQVHPGQKGLVLVS